MTYLSKKIWAETVDGFTITDCAVRTQSVLALCLRKKVDADAATTMWDHDIESRVLVVNLASDGADDKSYACRYLTGYNKPRVGIATVPLHQTLLVARNNDGQVCVMGGGGKFPDELIDPGKVPMTWRIKTLGGYAYSVGGQRKIYKRTEVGKWVRVLEVPRADNIETVGFSDMDAFSDTDMYAVGGHGDVWHFDGRKWRQMGFPSNVELGTVTCAGDGQVYISGEGGSLWAGRESIWKRVYEGGSSILWNDAVWFQDRLWLASDYQFKVWDGRQLEGVTHKGKPVPISGHMDARDGLLAVASQQVVMAYDGQSWRTIVAPYL